MTSSLGKTGQKPDKKTAKRDNFTPFARLAGQLAGQCGTKTGQKPDRNRTTRTKQPDKPDTPL